MWVCTIVEDNRFCSKSNVPFQWFYNCGCSRAEWTSSYKRNPGHLTENHINLRKSWADCTWRLKMLWRKIKQVSSILILHQVSAGPCWRPLLMLSASSKGSKIPIPQRLTDSAAPWTSSVHCESDKKIEVGGDYSRKTSSLHSCQCLGSKQRQNATKIRDMALGTMILKVFPQTGWGLQDGQSKSQCAKFRHFMVQWGCVSPGVKHLIDP